MPTNWLRYARGRVKSNLRAHSAIDNFPWFRAGYYAALDDIEKTGLTPRTDVTRRESADRALKRWVDTGSFKKP